MTDLPILDQPAEMVPIGKPARRLPRWLKKKIPKGDVNRFTANLLDELRLETVYDNAKCPNRSECYSQKTATFMILGKVCTRPCAFCAVAKGRTQPLEADEPLRVAQATHRLGLAHVVITSVTRDYLPDGGAEHFYQTVLAVRDKCDATVEVLTPDFIGNPEALDRVISSAPEVFNQHRDRATVVPSGAWSQEQLSMDAGPFKQSETKERIDSDQERPDAWLGRNARRVVRRVGRFVGGRLRSADAWPISSTFAGSPTRL